MLDRILNIPEILIMAGFQICQGYTRFWTKRTIIDIW